MDVIGITERKRKGIGTEIVRSCVHLYSGVSKNRRAERGVSILINKKFKKRNKELGSSEREYNNS
jgi:two-component sensor histidine kinase